MMCFILCSFYGCIMSGFERIKEGGDFEAPSLSRRNPKIDIICKWPQTNTNEYSASYWIQHVKYGTRVKFFLQLSYLGTLFWNQTNQSMCFKGRVEKSHVKLRALQFQPWSGKSNRMINHMQPSPTAKFTSLKIQSMWEQPWRLQMRSSRTLVHTNAQYQFHQINRITRWQP